VRRRASPAAILIALQLAAIVVVGGVTAVRFHIFASVDELPHVSYVQDIADQGALPFLGRTYVYWQMEAIEQDTYPRRSSVDPRHYGLAGYSYEAFQPPLYYLLAVPAFEIPSNYRDKVIAVRLFDLLLLAAALAVLWPLARAVARERWKAAYAAALAVVLWPGVIVRVITVSNAALELPLTLLYVLAVWEATRRRDPRLLLAAAGVLGLCLLTAMTLIFLIPLLALPAWSLLRERRDRGTLIWLGAAAILPLALLAPWVASNEVRYGALTATALAKQLQAPVVDPSGRSYGVGSVLAWLGRLDRAVLPQEWWTQYGKPGLGLVLRLLPGVLIAAALLPAIRRPRLLASPQAALLASPLPLGVLTMVAIVLFADWPSFLPRYVNPTLPLFALFAAWAWMRTRPREAATLACAAAASLIAAFTWVYMAGAYYFTHVGAALGIHAG
jgi:4-amino-4-deoxy-L-arabinose transferase-like glycosyltransferase